MALRTFVTPRGSGNAAIEAGMQGYGFRVVRKASYSSDDGYPVTVQYIALNSSGTGNIVVTDGSWHYVHEGFKSLKLTPEISGAVTYYLTVGSERCDYVAPDDSSPNITTDFPASQTGFGTIEYLSLLATTIPDSAEPEYGVTVDVANLEGVTGFRVIVKAPEGETITSGNVVYWVAPTGPGFFARGATVPIPSGSNAGTLPDEQPSVFGESLLYVTVEDVILSGGSTVDVYIMLQKNLGDS